MSGHLPADLCVPTCTCIHRGKVRVLIAPWCPDHGNGHWRVDLAAIKAAP